MTAKNKVNTEQAVPVQAHKTCVKYTVSISILNIKNNLGIKANTLIVALMIKPIKGFNPIKSPIDWVSS